MYTPRTNPHRRRFETFFFLFLFESTKTDVSTDTHDVGDGDDAIVTGGECEPEPYDVRM